MKSGQTLAFDQPDAVFAETLLARCDDCQLRIDYRVRDSARVVSVQI